MYPEFHLAMSSKDVGLRIRIEKDLREAFQIACTAEDRKASEVLREFMQCYVERHERGQGALFPELGETTLNRPPLTERIGDR